MISGGQHHGNLTDEPSLHYSPSGVAVLKFSVAVNGRRFDRQTNRWADKAGLSTLSGPGTQSGPAAYARWTGVG